MLLHGIFPTIKTAVFLVKKTGVVLYPKSPPREMRGGEEKKPSGFWGRRTAVVPPAFEPGDDNCAEKAADKAQQLPEQDVCDVRRKQRMTENICHQCPCREIKQPVHNSSTQTEGEAFRFERLMAKA